MNPEVERAITELREAYPNTPVTVRDDGEGGAYVIVEEADPGPVYRERVTWIGFRITFQPPQQNLWGVSGSGKAPRV